MSPASSQSFQSILFNALNNSLRRAGVEIMDRAPVVTLFMLSLRRPLMTRLLLDPPPEKESLILELLEDLDKETVLEVREFGRYMRPRLIRSEKPLRLAAAGQALWDMVHAHIPELCEQSGISRETCFKQLRRSAFHMLDLYEAFQGYAGGNDLGQYFTPNHVVRAMVWMVEILRQKPLGKKDVVYDPAAGVGGFLLAALEQALKNDPAAAPMAKMLMGFETTSSVAHLARMNIWLASGGRSCGQIETRSSLERDYLKVKRSPGEVTLAQDVPGHPMSALCKKNAQAPSVVLMNPPFPEDKQSYQSFEFVEHALRHLEDGGWLAALIPSVLVIGEDRLHQQFRQRMLEHAQLHAVITMPQTLFAPRASINTYVVIMQKRKGGHQLLRPVFFARAQQDGFEMDRGVRRRAPPRDEKQALARGWVEALGLGGNFADLFCDPHKKKWGQGSLFAHVHSLGPRHHSDEQATSVCLVARDGQDWAPERFIEEGAPREKVLKLANHIASEAACEQVRQSFLVGRAPEVSFEPIVESELRSLLTTMAGSQPLEKLFQIFPSRASGTKGWLPSGAVAVISATEQGNGICGYTEADAFTENGPFISVAKNGRPGIARVQLSPCSATGDVALLKPLQSWNLNQLCLLAAMIEIQAWRFNYGRKASELRLKQLFLG